MFYILIFLIFASDKTGQYAVTFRVRKRFKEPTKRQEDKTRHIRLFFTASSDNINETSDVQTAFPSRNANECYSRALIRNNKRYIIFLRESSESEIDMSRQKFHVLCSLAVQPHLMCCLFSS